MAKSYKLKDDNYIDSSSVVHNRIKLKDILTYSTQEIRIGTWIDGKPLYRKTIKIENTALAVGDNNIAHGISNLNQCIKAELSKNGSHVFPYFNYNANNQTLSMTFISNVNSTNITIRLMNDSWGSGNVWYATLYYTKTTD